MEREGYSLPLEGPHHSRFPVVNNITHFGDIPDVLRKTNNVFGYMNTDDVRENNLAGCSFYPKDYCISSMVRFN